jgi:PleD family two-component response regulator
MSHSSPSVLIVDSSDENREVLRTALARRGLRIFEADEPEQGLALAREHRPDVIVLDLDAEAAEHGQLEVEYSAEAAGRSASLVLLGRKQRSIRSAGTRGISKPYHFAPLVHTIELLAAKAA